MISLCSMLPLFIRISRAAYLVTFKCAHAFSSARSRTRHHATIVVGQFPHLDRLVKTTTNQVSSIRRERHRVDTIFMAFGAVKPFNQVPATSIPNSHTLVKRSCCNVLTIRGDSDGCYAIFDAKTQDLSIGFDVPDTDCTVSTTGSNVLAISSEVEGIDVLLMPRKCTADSAVLYVPNLSRY